MLTKSMLVKVLSTVALALVVATTLGQHVAKSPLNVFAISGSSMLITVLVALVALQYLPGDVTAAAGIEGFDSAPVGYVNGVMGGVDGVDLGPAIKDNGVGLIGGAGQVPAFFPTSGGDPAPGSPVPEAQEKMFMFARNQARPECCSSTQSASTGCVCMTQQQRQFLGNRGGNA